MGSVVPLVIARAVKRGFFISEDALTRLVAIDTLSRKDYQNLSYELVSVKELGLQWSCYKDIVNRACMQQYTLCPAEIALHLVASGPTSPIVCVSMLPDYRDGVGTVAQVELMHIKECENTFSPHAVFAFLRTS